MRALHIGRSRRHEVGVDELIMLLAVQLMDVDRRFTELSRVVDCRLPRGVHGQRSDVPRIPDDPTVTRQWVNRETMTGHRLTQRFGDAPLGSG